nr:acyl-CoA carboxylase subunit epsilon [Rhodococcus sp. (in: high G+C Gram-positive bacteria)]
MDDADTTTPTELDDAVVAQVRDAIRVVKGNPSDEEIAALVVVLSAAAAASGPATDTRPPELWGTPAAMHRTFAPFSPYSYAASRRY